MKAESDGSKLSQATRRIGDVSGTVWAITFCVLIGLGFIAKSMEFH
jgi:hypothetical protein